MAKNTTIHRIQIEGTSDLIKLRQELDGYQKDLKKVKKETKDGMTSGQAKKYQELSSSIKSTRKELNQAEKSLKGMNTSSKKGIGFIGKMAGAFTVATLAASAFQKISRAVTQAITNGVDTFRKYEFAMSKVRAISGATESEFKALDASAQELGRTTFFTAEQVANLQINFSKLGFTATETLNAQEAALDTAVATGEDLARTATVIGSTLRGFGLDASESGRVSDVMAASFTSSALTLEKFQTAMTKIAPIAKLMGFSLEKTTSVLGILTDAGIEASIAGTSLRNIFLKMSNPASDLSKSLGRTVGSSEELVEALEDLNKRGVDAESIQGLVNDRQVAAFGIMLNNVEAIKRQTEAYENSSGAAKAMADIVGDNLEGSMLRFKSAMQGLAIVITEKFAPSLTAIVEGFTKFVSFLSQAADVKLSEQLEEDRKKLITYRVKLNDSNLSLEDRKKLLVEIKGEFPDYLKGIDAEKLSLEKLNTSLKKVNDSMVNRVLIAREQEKISEKQSQLLDRRVDLQDQEAVVQDQITKVVDKYNLKLKENVTLEEQVANLLEQRPRKYGRLIDPMTELSHQMSEHQTIQSQINHLSNQENELIQKKTDLMDKLGIKQEDFNEEDDKKTTTTTPTGGKPVGGDENKTEKLIEDATALQDAELAMLNEKQNILQQFADGEIQSKAELNQQLKEMEIEHLQWVIDNNLAAGDELIAIEQRLLQAKVDSKVETKKGEVDRIDQMKETGKLLMQIGEAEGENSKIKAAGIKISQAAAVASGIQGLIDASGGIAAQAKEPFPLNLIAMAATAAQVASVITGIKALMGGSDKFEQGGLTNGGMFKGASHANGGVKFAVGGRIHEAEGGEAIINKRSTAMFKPMLSAMNQAGGGVKFANGGFLSTGEKFAMGGEVTDVQQMISGMGGTTQVVMVESDVTRTQGRVSNIESQATF